MSIELGGIAPDFSAETSTGAIRLHDWQAGEWCMFFSYPRDFSAVCMTELSAVARLRDELAKRKTKALGLSIVTAQRHGEWLPDFPAAQGCELNFPLVADPAGEIAALYGMVHPKHAEGVTARSLFLIDPAHKLRFYAMYPTGVGRNFDEALRILDAMQLNGRSGLTTPAGWRPGEDAVIPPSVTDEQARGKYGDKIRNVTPYLRMVPPPG
jgi:thioredoxin-dependent peroxiredoxin